MIKYHVPENEKDLDEIYVALSKDERGEGVLSIITPNGSFPIVLGKIELIEQFMPLIRQAAKDTNRLIKIYKFKKSELIKEITNKN